MGTAILAQLWRKHSVCRLDTPCRDIWGAPRNSGMKSAESYLCFEFGGSAKSVQRSLDAANRSVCATSDTPCRDNWGAPRNSGMKSAESYLCFEFGGRAKSVQRSLDAANRSVCATLMRHCVGHIIDPDANAQSRIARGVLWCISPFPRVAYVRLERDRHHQPAVIIEDPPPMIGASFALPTRAAHHRSLTRHLVAIVQIVYCVKDRLAIVQLHRLAIREDLVHALHEDFPFVLTPEVVSHEEAAPQQIFAHRLRLGIGELPAPRLHCIEPRPIVNRTLIQIHGLLYRPHMNPGQTAQRQHEVAVGPRIVLRPDRAALGPDAVPAKSAPTAAEASRAEAAAIPTSKCASRSLRIHQPRKGPLRLLLIVWGQGNVANVVLHTGKFAKRQLE